MGKKDAKEVSERLKFLKDRQRIFAGFQNTFNRLAKSYGHETVADALAGFHYSLPRHAPKKQSGRRTEFTQARLLDIWVFVQKGALLNGGSVSKFCNGASFTWYGAGGLPGLSGFSIKGATLRRRYYQAVEFLKKDSISVGCSPEAVDEPWSIPTKRMSPTIQALWKLAQNHEGFLVERKSSLK